MPATQIYAVKCPPAQKGIKGNALQVKIVVGEKSSREKCSTVLVIVSARQRD